MQGSIIGSLDAASGTLTKTGYQAYGENPGLTSGSYQYTARRFDAETAGSASQPSGLYYYRARMYSPAWGRFMQADPIGFAGGSNLYRYVANDPLNLTDPYGFAPDSPQPQAGGAGGNGFEPPSVAAAAAAEEPEDSSGNLIQVAQVGPPTGLTPEEEEFQASENEMLRGGGAVTLPGGESVLVPPPPALPPGGGLPVGGSAAPPAPPTNGIVGPYSTWEYLNPQTLVPQPLSVNTNVSPSEFSANLEANGYNATPTIGSNGPVINFQNGQGSTYTIYTRSSTGNWGAQYIGPNGQQLWYNLGQ